MAAMTGAQAIVKTLISYGVDTVFGLPGIQLDNLFDAFYEARNQIRVIHCRHEQGAAYMANGYAHSTGKVGVFTVVPGPGVLNACGAICTGVATSVPVLCITGQVPSGAIGGGMGMAHELKDQEAALLGIVDWVQRADTPEQAPAMLRDAFRQMRNGRNQPVVFEMPPDIMAGKADITLLDAEPADQSRILDEDAITTAARLLIQSKKPGIFVGGGIWGAEEELKQLAELLQMPVIMSHSGLGALSERHPLAHGLLGGQVLWNDMDVAIVCGTRFNAPGLSWGRKDAVKLIRIDIDPAQASKPDKPEVAIIAGARQSLAALIEAVSREVKDRPSRTAESLAIKDKVKSDLFALEPQSSFVPVIREELPEDGFLVTDITQMATFIRYWGPFYNPRSLITPGYQATLGAGFPTALGVQVAHPDKKVIAISGDGGFGFALQELSTAVAFNIPLVTIVFNDKSFGNVKYIQKTRYGARHISVDLHNPDLVKLAESFGALGIRAETADALRKAIRQGFAARRPTVIEVPIGEVPTIWGLVQRPPSDGPKPA